MLGEEVRIDPGIIASDSTKKPKAPGMKYKHYAPKADLVLVEGEQEAVVAEINALVREKQAAGLKVGVVATDETESLYHAIFCTNVWQWHPHRFLLRSSPHNLPDTKTPSHPLQQHRP